MYRLTHAGMTASVLIALLTTPFAGMAEQVITGNEGASYMTMNSKRIVSKYKAVFDKPTSRTPGKMAVDGPLMGNGNVAVTIGGPPELQQFWLCKNDFWRFKSREGQGHISGIGHMDVSIPELTGATVHTELSLYDARTQSVFSKGDLTVTMQSYVAAEHPLLVLDIACAGKSISGDITIAPLQEGGSESQSGEDKGKIWCVRKFEKDVDLPSAVAVVAKLSGTEAPAFVLTPGNSIRLVVALRSLFDGPEYLADARQLVDDVDIDKVHSAHVAWWQDFWRKSFVEVGDPVIEQRYYLSNYVMGSCSRDPDFPPSLFGPWVTVNAPGWYGDYHMNYNYQAPFYGLYSSDHIEQASTYHTPLLAFIERGRHYAKSELDCRGVYFPIGLGPKGLETTRHSTYHGNKSEGLFHQQKSNAAYGLVNVAFHWYSTYDPDYARTLYPLVTGVVDFWEDYLKYEKGPDGKMRYVIYKDAIHEWSGEDMNSLLSLGLVRNAFSLAMDMSKELGIDANRHAKWQHILDHLSEFPTQEMGGKRVFRYSEKGRSWYRSNTLGIQHIYPAGAIGLDSNPSLLETSRNMIDVLGRWFDGNGMSSFYPAAVRVGYDPQTILDRMRHMITHIGSANGFIERNPHGIENCSIVPNTINMMLCMGHQGILRVFPVWPTDKDARFAGLRVWGAFLVSGELKDGEVQYVQIESERGRPCTVQNPWPGVDVSVFRDGVKSEIASGARFVLATKEGETLRLTPIRSAPKSVVRSK